MYNAPDNILHPVNKALKNLASEISNYNKGSKRPIFGFIDFHAHSNKKSVFLYGSGFPLHEDNYVKVRIIAKLLSERTQMFR